MKKGKMIFLMILTIIICITIPIFLNKSVIQRKLEIAKREELEKEKYEEMLKSDEVAPILILTQDKLVMYQGDEINYKSFIKEASDNLEGNLIERVKYNELDVNKIGEFVVSYEVSDKALNTTKIDLQVIIKEKPNFKYLD